MLENQIATYSVSRQIVFDDRLPDAAVRLEFAADVSRRVRAIAVNVDFVDSALHVAQQSQFLAGPLVSRFLSN